MFAVGGFILFWLLYLCGEWAWNYFGKPSQWALGGACALVAGVTTLVLWRNEEIFGLATEVASELRKVTWPSRKETFSSTIVVIVTSIIASLILGLFDGVWSWVTRLIYG
jgi:preprotein translocase subunit SecE